MKNLQTFSEFLNEASKYYDEPISKEAVIASIDGHKWTSNQKTQFKWMLPEEQSFVKSWIEEVKKAMSGLDNSGKTLDWQQFDKRLHTARGTKPLMMGMDARHLFLGKQTFDSWLSDLLFFTQGKLYIPGKQIGSANWSIAARTIAMADLGFADKLSSNANSPYKVIDWAKAQMRGERSAIDQEVEEWYDRIESEEDTRNLKNTSVKLFDPYADTIALRGSNEDAVHRL